MAASLRSPAAEGLPAAASDPAPGPGAEATPALEWTFNPWRERPLQSTLALAATLGVVGLLARLGTSPLGCLALGGGVAAALAPLLAPVRCRLDDQGIARRGPLGWERRAWEDLGRVAEVRGGLLASPFERPRPLDRIRALLLPVPAAERAALLASIGRRLDARGRALAH